MKQPTFLGPIYTIQCSGYYCWSEKNIKHKKACPSKYSRDLYSDFDILAYTDRVRPLRGHSRDFKFTEEDNENFVIVYPGCGKAYRPIDVAGIIVDHLWGELNLDKTKETVCFDCFIRTERRRNFRAFNNLRSIPRTQYLPDEPLLRHRKIDILTRNAPSIADLTNRKGLLSFGKRYQGFSFCTRNKYIYKEIQHAIRAEVLHLLDLYQDSVDTPFHWQVHNISRWHEFYNE